MERRSELQAGIFVAVALGLFLLSIFTLGRERQLFASQKVYFTTFRDVKGLSQGAPIRLGGITVGRVEEIGFSPDLSDPRVQLRMLINDNYLDRIRKDTVVTIETQGLLGDRFLSLSAGSSPDRLLPESMIASRETGDISEMLAKAGQVVDNTADISQQVAEFLREFREETLDDFSATIESLSKITREIEQGDGLFHRLIYSERDGQDILDSLSQAATDLKNILSEVESGHGLLHALIYDRNGKKTVSALRRAADNLAETSSHVSHIAKEVIEGNGVLHDLVYAESRHDLNEIVAKLDRTASNLEEASQALTRGEGTLGALLVDAKLYDNLVKVTDEAERSIILRHAIRSSLEK